MISVGIIDTIGFVGAVNALDTCLKTADVQFVRFEKMSGGIVSIIIKGDVGAVSASIMAGIEAAAAVGELSNHTIIARLDDQSAMMLNKSVDQQSQESGGDSDSNGDSRVAITELKTQARCEEPAEPMLVPINQKILLESVTETEEEAEIETKTEAKTEAKTDTKTDTKTETSSYSEAALNLMTVSQLRRLARELNIRGISREKIKRSRKVDLIVNILAELNESTELKKEEE